DRAVLLDRCQVAWERPALALGLDERAGCLLGVVVVADGDAAGLGDAADRAGAGLHALEVVVEHGVGVVDDETAAFGRPSLIAGLRRAAAAADGYCGEQRLRPLLD